jgi:hypothetical protein
VLTGLLLGSLCSSSVGQTTSVHIPAKTPLSIQLLQHVPMKAGESLEGRLLYPVIIRLQFRWGPRFAARSYNLVLIEAAGSVRASGEISLHFTSRSCASTSWFSPTETWSR